MIYATRRNPREVRILDILLRCDRMLHNSYSKYDDKNDHNKSRRAHLHARFYNLHKLAADMMRPCKKGKRK